MKTRSTLLFLAALAAGLFLSACGGSEPAPAAAENQPSPFAAAAAPAPAPPEPVPSPVEPELPAIDPPGVSSAPAAQPVQPAPATRDFRAEAAKYIGYYNSYRLTPEQEDVKETALSRMPAPCCADNTMATCCCPCNLAKAVWGMSAHLIVEEGYDADRLEKTVRGWLADANPKGWSGRACYTGGCSNSFHQDGCGGMVEGYVF
jgi:hypothetical protein